MSRTEQSSQWASIVAFLVSIAENASFVSFSTHLPWKESIAVIRNEMWQWFKRGGGFRMERKYHFPNVNVMAWLIDILRGEFNSTCEAFISQLYEPYAFVASCDYTRRKETPANMEKKWMFVQNVNGWSEECCLVQLPKSARLHGDIQRRSKVADGQG